MGEEMERAYTSVSGANSMAKARRDVFGRVNVI